jgi:glycosyltransferase involved in cell wall biosynthesis
MNQNICSNVVCVPGGWGTHSQYSGYDILADRLESLGARIERAREHSFAARLAGKFWLEASGLSRMKLTHVYGARMFLDERRLRLSAANASVVHFLSAENSFSFLRRPNIVCTFHGTPKIWDESLRSREPLKALRAAIALAPNQVPYLRQSIQDVVLIPYGVDPMAFAPGNPSLKSRGALRLVVVGSFMRDFEALDRIARATADRSDLEFLILGPLKETRRFQRYAHCRVLPRLTYMEYLAFLQGADALFLPLLDAAANTAIVEAMACGLAVLTNRGEGQAYYVGDAGWLYENEEEALNILNDPSLKEQCVGRGAKARARILERFSWDKVAPQVVELYSRLV